MQNNNICENINLFYYIIQTKLNKVILLNLCLKDDFDLFFFIIILPNIIC